MTPRPFILRNPSEIDGLKPPILSIDYEWNVRTGQPSILGLSDERAIVSVPHSDGHPHLLQLLEKYPDAQWLGHNFCGAESEVWRSLGIRIRNEQVIDTIALHYLLNMHLCKSSKKVDDEEGEKRGRGFMNLYAMCSLYTDCDNWKACVGEEQCLAERRACPEHSPFDYNGTDTYWPLRAYPKMLQIARMRGVDKLYPLHRDLLLELQRVKERGVRVNVPYIDTLRSDFERDRAELGASFAFNPNSPPQTVAWFKQHGILLENSQEETIREAVEATEASETLDEAGASPQKVLAALLEYKELGKGPDRWFAPRKFDYDKNEWEGYVDENGYIHCSLGIFTSTGRFNCFSSDTEVLTKRGWLYFDDLTESDHVAQFNTENHEITFVRPDRIIRQYHDGILKAISTDQQINLLVTPDHDCLLQQRWDKRWVKFRASDYPEDCLQYGAGEYRSGTLSLTSAQVRIIAALQADGSINECGGIAFGFKKQRKIRRLQKALKDCGIPFSLKDGRFYISCHDAPFWWIDKKVFGSWITSLDWKSLRLLAAEVFYWDGCYTRKNHYSSSIRQNADWVQILEVLSGKRARLRSYQNSTPNAALNWQVDVSSRSYSMTTNRQIESVKYRGLVYCVSMPKGTVVVRRGQDVAISGNCTVPNLQNVAKRRKDRKTGESLGKRVRRAIIAPDGYRLYRADYKNAENVVFLTLAGYRDLPETDFHSVMRDRIGIKEDDAFALSLGGAREAAKSVTHSTDYFEGIKLVAKEQLRKPSMQREIAAGARLAFPDWTVFGKVVTFTGINLANRAFGDHGYENRKRALDVQVKYFNAFPKLRELQKRITAQVERERCVRPPTGYVHLSYGYEEDRLKTAAAMWGSNPVAQFTKYAILRAAQHPKLFEALVLQVHDEFLFVVDCRHDPRDVKQWIQEVMVFPLPEVPEMQLRVDVSVGDNWADQSDIA